MTDSAQSTSQSGFVAIALKDSSNLASARWDSATGQLDVEFRNGGKYSYSGFTEAEAKAWSEAKSAGGWFDVNIKKQPLKHPLIEKIPPASTPAVPARAEDGTFGAGDTSPPATQPTDPVVVAAFVHADVLELAETMYQAYTKNSGGKTWDGRQCPSWSELGQVMSHWCAAATVAFGAVSGVGPGEIASLLTQLAHLKRTASQADQLAKTRLEEEVMLRCKLLDDECSGLRGQVAKLEAERRKFRPWQQGQ